MCFPVDSAGSQDLSHVMGSSGLITGGTSGQEITLTINNPSLTQALASASCSSAAAGNPQEITLTISGMGHLTQCRSMKKIHTNTHLQTVYTNLVFSRAKKQTINNKQTDEIKIPSRICNTFIDFLTQANMFADTIITYSPFFHF